MKIIGITGGIGAGKTAVLDILRDEYGAYVMEADALAHRLMLPGGACYEAVVAEFGENILAQDRTIDRKKLGAVVFGDKEKLELLNSLTHPQVGKAIIASVDEQRKAGCSLYVLEAALLIQEGYMSLCDEMWYIRADESVRIDRLCKYRGYTRERAERVIASQPPDSFYEANCTRVIDNSRGLSELGREMEKFIKTFHRNEM